MTKMIPLPVKYHYLIQVGDCVRLNGISGKVRRIVRVQARPSSRSFGAVERILFSGGSWRYRNLWYHDKKIYIKSIRKPFNP